jgi:hypothetical protein
VALNGVGDGRGEVDLRINGVQLAGLDERPDNCPVLGAAVGTGEEGVLTGEGDRADRAFDGFGIDLDCPVVDKAV